MPSLTPRLIMTALKERGYECSVVGGLTPRTFIMFTDKTGRQRYISGAVTDKTSAAACRIVDDKLATAAIAQRLGISVPQTVLHESSEQAQAFLHEQQRIVVKPLDAAHGNGVTTNVTTGAVLADAVQRARQFSPIVLLQRQVAGRDVRLLFINGKLCAAAERRPANVTGDSQHTVRELILQTNERLDRGTNYQKKYNVIPVAVSESFLGSAIDDVPNAGQVVQVIGTANIGSGGTALDITDSVASALVAQGERLVNELGAGVYGVDFLEGPEGSFLIEINASPSFGLHHFPHEGQPRDAAGAFVDWLVS